MIQHFSFENTDLEGLILIKPFVAYDDRGYLIKDYSKDMFIKNNIDLDLKEVFYTNSKKGTIRALHFQSVYEQSKLVRCVFGKVYDVVVDLRKDSKTFGKYQSFYLSEENKYQLLIPKGFGHGYLVLEDSIVSYKCDEKFYGEYDDGILYNDIDLGIDWPINLVENIIISDKDKNLQTFKEYTLKCN